MPINELLKLDPAEKVISDIRRHPIGLWAWYVFGIFSILGLLGTLYWLIRAGEDFAVDLPESLYIALFSFLVILFATFTLIGTYVYKQNRLVITNENVLQVLQFGLFNQQVSQLNLAKIQDVSVDKAGILPSIFDFGTLDIETAGEQYNFRFKYTADPYKIAKIIIEAHEDFIKEHHTANSNRL